jgi:hypothetical protein
MLGGIRVFSYRIVGPAFRDAYGNDADHADWQVTMKVSRGSVSNVQVDTLGEPATPNPMNASACFYLWPANGELVAITTVPPNADDILVYSNEADESETVPDAVIDEDGSLWLRAERDGSGIGRVYLVVAVFADEVSCCTVVAPHDKSVAAITAIEFEAALAEMECLIGGAAPDGYALIRP